MKTIEYKYDDHAIIIQCSTDDEMLDLSYCVKQACLKYLKLHKDNVYGKSVYEPIVLKEVLP